MVIESSSSHPSWIEVNLRQFKKNISSLKKHLRGCLLCVPVKANAYGHGLVAMGKAAEAAGADYLAVAHLKEAAFLRQADIRIPILLLGALQESQITQLLDLDIEFTINSQFIANLVANQCVQIGRPCKVHLEIDTGMQRTGIRPEQVGEFLDALSSSSAFQVKGIYSHLATAEHERDAIALAQIDLFRALLQQARLRNAPLVRHLANSNGVLHFPSSYFEMVRPARLVFGYKPQNSAAAFAEIAPCFSVKSRISYSKIVEEGQGISYGHTYTTSKRTHIVTVPIGYGDGYRSVLSNKAFVLIRGRRFPIVGKICMDQLMVDMGECEAYLGEEVVLLGKQGEEEISVQEISTLYRASIYEVLCSFNERLSRLYVE